MLMRNSNEPMKCVYLRTELGLTEGLLKLVRRRKSSGEIKAVKKPSAK